MEVLQFREKSGKGEPRKDGESGLMCEVRGWGGGTSGNMVVYRGTSAEERGHCSKGESEGKSNVHSVAGRTEKPSG